MAVAYTQEQLTGFEQAMADRAPPFPVAADLQRAGTVVAMTSAGSAVGVLMHFQLANGERTMLYFNPVVAKQLVQAVSVASSQSQWWDEKLTFIPAPGG